MNDNPLNSQIKSEKENISAMQLRYRDIDAKQPFSTLRFSKQFIFQWSNAESVHSAQRRGKKKKKNFYFVVIIFIVRQNF